MICPSPAALACPILLTRLKLDTTLEIVTSPAGMVETLSGAVIRIIGTLPLKEVGAVADGRGIEVEMAPGVVV